VAATRAGVFGVGAALPEAVITNDDLPASLDTNDAWIVRRTGIRERRRLAAGDSLARLAAAACAEALEDAGRTADDVDRILAATITPDQLTPGLAVEVAGLLGCGPIAAVDVNAACSGFIVALDQAASLIESGRARCVLVCGAEALSRITDHEERSTAVLFGDGAGAVVVAAGDLELGCADFTFGSSAEHAGLLYAGRDERKLRMNGSEVYRHAVRRMVEATRTVMESSGLGVDDIDVFVAHQANARIIETAASELGIDAAKVVINVDRVANTSSASIPLALWQAERDGILRPGARVVVAAFGAGFIWGAGVLSWKERVHVCA
jgi:3-oxoacyl-[acyl-carrier-protein] synthase-3